MVSCTSPTRVKALLDELELRPRKAWGQSFLVDANIRDIIVGLADPTRADTVLEIGPGLGVLTEALLGLAGRVRAVELDRRLCAHLARQYGNDPRFALICGDALDLAPADAAFQGLTKMVSNLPYAVASRILVHLALAPAPPPLQVVMVQQDVAERMAAPAGGKEYGLLSVILQVVYDVALAKEVSPSCFYPAPHVWSAVVTLRRRAAPDLDAAQRRQVLDLVRAAFSQRRKQLKHLADVPLLRGKYTREAFSVFLASRGVDPQCRPENVTPDQWASLAGALLTGTPS